jgi:hypothetical protein
MKNRKEMQIRATDQYSQLTIAIELMAEPTGLEPATSDVTGRRSNQLNYDSAFSINPARPIPNLKFQI